MWYDNSCYKRIIGYFVLAFIIISFYYVMPIKSNNLVYAETSEIEDELNQNINDILNGIDTDEFDNYIIDDFNDNYFSVDSFKDLVSKILSGELFFNFDGLIEYFVGSFKIVFQKPFSLMLTIFVIVVLYEIFALLCIDKYAEFKNNIKFIFSLIIVLFVMEFILLIRNDIGKVITNIFEFSNILFPILLGLMLTSGAESSFSVYSSLSAVILNSGIYVFKIVLMPLAISILILTIFELIIKDGRFNKLTSLLKYIFKLIISIVFTVFGLFSAINIISSSVKDGLSLKITKYAIKNYIPILGGYISEGFDFVKTCSVLIKNAFGVGGIFILFFTIVKPFLIYLSLVFAFKILSVLTGFVGNQYYSNIFDKISKSFSYIIAILVGLFLIMVVFLFLIIISVSVI